MPQASREFQVFVKPAGAVCNLDCRYCYYLEKEHLYPPTPPHRMPADLLEQYIVQHLDAAPGPTVMFSWHGGEPTILGLEYFRTITELQRRHARAGLRVTNGIQTNGLLLDEDWCRFFAAEGFSVGLSLDGPEDLHDAYRVNKGGKPTFASVMRAFRLLRRVKVACDILCVVHDLNVRHPLPTYRFFKEIGVQYLSFLPLVARGPNGPLPGTVPAAAYGDFLCAIFDEWVRQDIGRIEVQTFDEACRPARGVAHALCILRETCGDIPVVEHNGDVYSCDHFVDPEYRLGNIRETPLVDLLEGPQQRDFGDGKRDTLPRYCRTCDVRALCNGGCPKDRFIMTPDGEEGLNYLCEGFQRFYRHVLPYSLRLAALERVGRPREYAMAELSREHAHSAAAIGRNDPCPCGSGRKYKKCCLAG